jgi:hypothetical protein
MLDVRDRARLKWTVTAIAAIAATVAYLPASASAASVALWACHGPGGEPLGSAPFSSTASGDGRATGYGNGCEGPAGTGGLTATFSRPDPAGGSVAAWRLDVPSGVVLGEVRIVRATSGFGGTQVSGDPQMYEAATSSTMLELAALDQPSDVPLGGELSVSGVTGRFVRVGVRCEVLGGQRCAAPPEAGATVGVEVSSVALGVLDGSPPVGAVEGVRSPVESGETIMLLLEASDTGLGLAGAEASIDGRRAAFARLGAGACPEHPASDASVDLPLGVTGCPKSVSNVPLAVSWRGVPVGSHRLRVTVTDAAGNTTTLVDRTIEVRSPPPAGSNTVTIGICSHTVFGGCAPGGGPPGGGPPGEGSGGGGSGGGQGGKGGVQGITSSAEVCRSPMLSMRLVSKPLRRVRAHRRRIPVLRAGRRYRYRGRLTCLPAGAHRRVSAPTGTVVKVLYKIGRRRVKAGRGTMVVHKGRLSALLGYRTSLTIIFSYRTSGGPILRVKIRTKIAHRHARRRTHRR